MGNTIGSAPLGQNTSIVGNEKLPLSGSQYATLQTIKSWIQNIYTLGGTSTAYTLTTASPAPALTTGESWWIIPNATAGATPTLNRDGLGAKNLKYYDGTGTLQSVGATTFYINVPYKITYDGTQWIVSGVPTSGGGTWGSITGTLSSQTDLLYALEPQQGGVRNGKISVTVASNNLTLALKTQAGNNPSASEPVYIYIGGAWRTVTAALSVTKNAGTNWCNSGSAELATQEIDYFAYIGYNATDGVVIGFSRIPYARIYSDFNTTSTNEKYAAISTITTAAASDEYVVIGRFAATLSAGAGYTWSVPTYTAKNLYQSPILETRWLNWTPQNGTGYTTLTITAANYRFRGPNMQLNFYISATATAVATLGFTMPFSGSVTANLLGVTTYNSGKMGYSQTVTGTPWQVNFRNYDFSNFAAGTVVVTGIGEFVAP